MNAYQLTVTVRGRQPGPAEEHRREIAVIRYTLALDRTYLEAVEIVLREAEDDPGLDRIIARVDRAPAEEEGLEQQLYS